MPRPVDGLGPEAGLVPGDCDGGVWVVVVAAGSGSRFGGPKLSSVIGGRTVLDRSLTSASVHADGLVLVANAATPDTTVAVSARAVGGETRSASVRNGLAMVPVAAAIVVVHDAARPLASPELFAAAIAAIRAGADAAITAVAVVDTIKRVDGRRVVETVDRSSLVAVQTPQAFRASVLRAAHANGGDATDDAALVEAAGGTVVIVDGDPRNRKLTTVEDLAALTLFAAAMDSAESGAGLLDSAQSGAGATSGVSSLAWVRP